MNRPPVVSEAEWRRAREALLVKEKAETRARDALAAERRRLPMVRVEKEYALRGPSGTVGLGDLFEGGRQLVVYHFMFDPSWDAGCAGCSMMGDSIGHLAHLRARRTAFAMVSRAPWEKLDAYRQRMGWDLPWYSSFGTDFNDDFDATRDGGEVPGMSVFLRDGDEVFRTYHTSARGVETVVSTAMLLDLTPYGRQEDWEDSPEGWPQDPTYTWGRRHDEYTD